MNIYQSTLAFAGVIQSFPNSPDASGLSGSHTFIKFPGLFAGQSITVNGLTFTAKSDVNGNTVSTLFGEASTIRNSLDLNANLELRRYTGIGNFSGIFGNDFNFSPSWGYANCIFVYPSGSGGMNNTDARNIPISSNASIITNDNIISASTVYGTVILKSNNTFTIQPGSNSKSTNGNVVDTEYKNFTNLGFKSGAVNKKI